jgi:hypothetical protein
MELAFIFYLFAAFIIIPATFFILTRFKMYIAALIVSIALLIYFILFGLQIFTPEGNFNQSESSTITKFPPTISMCPDMFTLYQDVSGGQDASGYFCVEMVGLGSGINTYRPTNQANVPTDPTTANMFDLKVNIQSDPDRKNELIAECKRKRITWEGIYDGIQEYNNIIPRPDRSK